jgi:nicotinamide-nucleotide amidase
MTVRTAEIIAVGSELLLGGRAETNSLFLTDALGTVGVEVRFKSVIGDDERDIASAVRAAARRASVIIMTGGLGPTRDDRTRGAVARVTGRPLQRHAEALAGIRQRLAAWGRTPTASQLRQALIPRGAAMLPNPVGSAPGFCVLWKGRFLVALPGVPVEAERMFTESVMPRLAKQARVQDRTERRLFHTLGLPESEVDDRLKGLVPPGGRVHVGTLASPLGVTVSLTLCGGLSSSRLATLERTAAEVRTRLGSALYGEGIETMEKIVGRLLVAGGLTLAVAESCTGGLIGHRLTQVPGSSSYVDRVIVCYSDRAKMELLGVPEDLIRRHGAVSAEVAAAMATGVRMRSGVPVGLSVTGIAGPGGGSEGKPVGLVYVGLAVGAALETREFHFHGDRQAIKLRASQAALNLLRLWLVTGGGTRT